MLSIITATRYRPELLAKAIDSLAAQTCQDFEWIVINDGCDPNTREVVTRSANFPHTYLEMTHPTTGFGLSIGRNRGLILAVGDIVTYLDDDNTMNYPQAASLAWGFCRFVEPSCLNPPQFLTAGIEVEPDSPRLS